MTALKLIVTLLICIVSLFSVVHCDKDSNEQKKSKRNANKKQKKQQKIHVKAVDLDFDVVEVISAEPTAMIELEGGEFDFGSQFHFEGDKVTSPKVKAPCNSMQ